MLLPMACRFYADRCSLGHFTSGSTVSAAAVKFRPVKPCELFLQALRQDTALPADQTTSQGHRASTKRAQHVRAPPMLDYPPPTVLDGQGFTPCSLTRTRARPAATMSASTPKPRPPPPSKAMLPALPVLYCTAVTHSGNAKAKAVSPGQESELRARLLGRPAAPAARRARRTGQAREDRL